MNIEDWTPPWSARDQSRNRYVVVTNTTAEGTLTVFHGKWAPKELAWTNSWLQSYRERLNAANRLRDAATFAYINVSDACTVPDGVVSSPPHGVTEVGFGTDPVGPPDGVEVELSTLFEAVQVAMIRQISNRSTN